MENLDKRLEVIDAFHINRESGNVDIFGRNNKFLYHVVNDLNDGKTLSEEKIAKPFWYNFPKEWDFGYASYGGWIRFAPWITSGVDGIWHLIYEGILGKRSLMNDIKWYEERVCDIRRIMYKNYVNELEESVSDINLYQGSIDEVSKQIGRSLELVDLKTPKTFIEADNERGYVRVQEESIGPFTSDFMLRLKAKEVGADAVVHYMHGSSIGTPVKFVDKK